MSLSRNGLAYCSRPSPRSQSATSIAILRRPLPLTPPVWPVPIGLARILQDSTSVQGGFDNWMGGHPMNKRELRGLLDQVKAGGLSRRAFVKRMAAAGLTAPMATQLLALSAVALPP